MEQVLATPWNKCIELALPKLIILPLDVAFQAVSWQRDFQK
jgi:hypothetical protein